MNRTLTTLSAGILTAVVLPLGAAPALAQTPPAPTPSLDKIAPAPPKPIDKITPAPAEPTPPKTVDTIAPAPLKDSGKKFGTSSQSWTQTSFTQVFRANVDTVIMQVSDSPATKDSSGRYTMGAAQPVVVSAPQNGGGGLKDPNAMRTFTKTVEGLEPGRVYHYLFTIPTGAGFKPVQMIGSVSTLLHGQHSISKGHSWVDVSFVSSQPAAWVSLGKSATPAGNHLTGANAIMLHGEKISDGDVPRFRYMHRFNSLTPGTAYNVLTAVAGNGTQEWDQELLPAPTGQRQVTVSVEKIVVHDDADRGLRGKGELLFQARGTTAPTKSGSWSNGYGETSIGSGETRTISAAAQPRHQFTTTANQIALQVEGRENDAVTKKNQQWCASHYSQPGTNHTARWVNQEESGAGCYQFSYGENAVELPTSHHAGTWTAYREVKVARSPDLRFTATVRIEVKSN